MGEQARSERAFCEWVSEWAGWLEGEWVGGWESEQRRLGVTE